MPRAACQVITLDHKRYKSALDQVADSHRKSQLVREHRHRRMAAGCLALLRALRLLTAMRAARVLTASPRLGLPPLCRSVTG